jgi:putative DNA primase/helicase
MLLAVANGVIDLATGDFRPGRPDDYIRTATPTVWQGLNAPAPRWERFLKEIFVEDSALIAFMQRLLGYAITGKVTEHILPILWGHGRNGKDTLLETLRVVLGPSAGPVSKDVLIDKRTGNSGSASPHIYALRWLRLAWASETNAGAKFNAEQVKLLTGGGTLTARPLYGGMVTFAPKYTLLLLTNHKPRADADDYALWNRLLLIPFTQSFVDKPKLDNEHKADPHLLDKLKAEASGILAWLIRGCLAYQRDGLNPPASVRLATEAYQQEEDDLAQFIEECCIIGPSYQVEAGPLYRAYETWAKGYGKIPWGSRTFGEKIVRRFKRDDGRIRVYYGIGLLQN